MTTTRFLVLCLIGCSQGVRIPWEISGTPLHYCVLPGEEIVFEWKGDHHNVNQVTTEEQFENCEGFTNYDGEEGPETVTKTAVGDYYFVCGVGSHCLHGNQKALIRVRESCTSSHPQRHS